MFCPTIPFSNKPLLAQEKRQVASIFSFSHNVFYPIKEKMHHLSDTEIVFCKAFKLDRAKILSSAKGLNGTQL